MDIKKASIKDYEKILEIWNSTSSVLDFNINKYDKKILSNIAKDKDKVLLVAKLNKEVIGTILAKLDIQSGFCYVNKLIIDTIYRNKGVGSKLLKEIEKFAKKKKCKRISLLGFNENEIFNDFLIKQKYEAKTITMFQKKL